VGGKNYAKKVYRVDGKAGWQIFEIIPRQLILFAIF
jgi:hypothetical protein